MNYTTDYAIKCDECRVEIGRTSSVNRSAAGGRCDAHTSRTHIGDCPECGFAISQQSLNDGFVVSLEHGYTHLACMLDARA